MLIIFNSGNLFFFSCIYIYMYSTQWHQQGGVGWGGVGGTRGVGWPWTEIFLKNKH